MTSSAYGWVAAVHDIWILLRQGPIPRPRHDDPCLVRFMKYAWFCAVVFVSVSLSWAIMILWTGPQILTEELFVKPHRRWLLGSYKFNGIRVVGLVQGTSRDHMIVEYSTASDTDVDASQENDVILKCVWRQYYDFDKKIVDESVTLLVLPGLPPSGYAEEIVLQQWEAERFYLIRFLAQIGLALAYISFVTLLAVVGGLPLLGQDNLDANVSDSRGFFILITLIAKTALRCHANFLFLLPILLQMGAIKLDREMYLTTMKDQILRYLRLVPPQDSKKLCALLASEP